MVHVHIFPKGTKWSIAICPMASWSGGRFGIFPYFTDRPAETTRIRELDSLIQGGRDAEGQRAVDHRKVTGSLDNLSASTKVYEGYPIFKYQGAAHYGQRVRLYKDEDRKLWLGPTNLRRSKISGAFDASVFADANDRLCLRYSFGGAHTVIMVQYGYSEYQNGKAGYTCREHTVSLRDSSGSMGDAMQKCRDRLEELPYVYRNCFDWFETVQTEGYVDRSRLVGVIAGQYQLLMDHPLPLTQQENFAKMLDQPLSSVANFYESVPGFASVSESIRDTGSAFKNLLSGRTTPKELASQYLGYLYGYRQLPSETVAILDEACSLSTASLPGRAVIRKTSTVPLTYGDSRGTLKLNAKLAYAPIDNPFANWYRDTYESGWAPSASNWWATVRLSFVVDWFTNIGRTLERMDTANYWKTFRVISSLSSEKVTYGCAFFDPSGVPNGVLDHTRYTRMVNYPTKAESLSFWKNGDSSSHVLEAAALLVVNK